MSFTKQDPILRQTEGLLTPRQMEILEEVALGKTNREISEELEISYQTVKNHLSY